MQILHNTIIKTSWCFDEVIADGLVPIGICNHHEDVCWSKQQNMNGESCLWPWQIQMLLSSSKHIASEFWKIGFHHCHCIAAIFHRHESKEKTDDKKNSFRMRFVRMRLTHQSSASDIYCNRFTWIQNNRKWIWYSKPTNNIEWVSVHSQWYISENSQAVLHLSDTRKPHILCDKTIVRTIITVRVSGHLGEALYAYM